jgi:hypothetical protein
MGVATDAVGSKGVAGAPGRAMPIASAGGSEGLPLLPHETPYAIVRLAIAAPAMPNASSMM